MTPPLTNSNNSRATPASSVVAEKLNSEAQGVVTVATPDNHRDRKRERGGQSGPAKGDQHRGGTAEVLRGNTERCYLSWVV